MPFLSNNKSLVKEPAQTWDAMFAQKKDLYAKGVATIAWSFDEVYWFLPFLVGHGGWPLNNGKIELNTPAMDVLQSESRSLNGTHSSAAIKRKDNQGPAFQWQKRTNQQRLMHVGGVDQS